MVLLYLFQHRLQFPDVCQSSVKLPLVRAAASELEYRVSCRVYCSCGDLQQFQPDSVDPQLPHGSCQRQPPEPVEQVVRKHVYSQTVLVDYFGMTADRGKIKAAFAFFDEVFHLAPAAVEPDQLLLVDCGEFPRMVG